LYFADQMHAPYGPRPLEEIRKFVRGIIHFFLRRNVKAIVLACNAASAAGLHQAREIFPEIPFVGMEPAVKPAAEHTQKGVIGVITTKATYQGELFASVVDRYASHIQVVTQVCPEFVTLVEAGELDGEHVLQVAQEYLNPLLEKEIDQLVLGCTHFPFLIPVLKKVVGNSIDIIDPSPAIARQIGRIIAENRNSDQNIGQVMYFTSGDTEPFHQLSQRLLDNPIEDSQVFKAIWRQDDTLVELIDEKM
jgi:glutamate racemase